LMRSSSAGPASSHYTARIRPALIGFADEVRGTLARLSAYGMALALLAILSLALCNALPDAMVAAPSAKGGWSQMERPARAFAVGQANLHEKTEAYATFRHPGGGRKDILRWAAADQMPVAELEIYRLGGELHQQGPVAAELAAGMDPGGAWELEAAGVIDSKFGTVTLLRPAPSPPAPVLDLSSASTIRLCGSPAGPARATMCRPAGPRSAAC
jgi:hypothetical protein